MDRDLCTRCVNRPVCRAVCAALKRLLRQSGIDLWARSRQGVVPVGRKFLVLQARQQEMVFYERLITIYSQVLSPRQQLLCRLYYGQRMTITEIARQLNVNRSTVSRTLQRGRLALLNARYHGNISLGMNRIASD